MYPQPEGLRNNCIPTFSEDLYIAGCYQQFYQTESHPVPAMALGQPEELSQPQRPEIVGNKQEKGTLSPTISFSGSI